MLMLFKVGISLQKLFFPAISLHGYPLATMGKNAGILPRCCGNVRRVKVGLQDQAMLSLAGTSGELDVCSQRKHQPAAYRFHCL